MCTASRSRHNPHPLPDATASALASVDGLLRLVANRHASAMVPAEDLWQEARIAFVEALPTYDPQLSKLSTWAADIARYAALRYVRDLGALVRKPAWLWERNQEGDREHVARGWDDNDHLRESGRDDRRGIESEIFVGQMLRCLSVRQRQVMELDLRGWSDREIGATLGLADRCVAAYRRIAVRKLRAYWRRGVRDGR